MTKHLQKQLKHQRQMLHLELPPSTSRILSKLLNRGYENCDDELNSIDNGNIEMGALPSPADKTAKVVVKIKIQKKKLKIKNQKLSSERNKTKKLKTKKNQIIKSVS